MTIRNLIATVAVSASFAAASYAGIVAEYNFDQPPGQGYIPNGDYAWRYPDYVAPSFSATHWLRPGFGDEVTNFYAYNYENVHNRYLNSHFWIFGGGYEFNITATETFSLTDISFQARSNIPSPALHQLNILYSTSADYSNPKLMGSYNFNNTAGWTDNFALANPLTDAAPGTYYFKFAVQAVSNGVSAPNSYSLQLDNVHLNGTSPSIVAIVPEPAGAGLLVALTPLALRRRSRDQ